jgi:hypothetical protein
MAPIAARTPETAARATGGRSTTSFIRDRISGGSSSTHYAIKERHVILLIAIDNSIIKVYATLHKSLCQPLHARI